MSIEFEPTSGGETPWSDGVAKFETPSLPVCLLILGVFGSLWYTWMKKWRGAAPAPAPAATAETAPPPPPPQQMLELPPPQPPPREAPAAPTSYQSVLSPYEQLPFSDTDKEAMKGIIEWTAKVTFPTRNDWKKKREWEEQVAHVHPLRVLAYICSDRDVKPVMKQIFSNWVKKSVFLGAYRGKLNGADLRDEYVAGFAKEMGLGSSIIDCYFPNRLWNELITFLVNRP